MMTVENFRQALADFIESPEGKAELQPFFHEALHGVNPLAQIGLTLFIEALLASTSAALRSPIPTTSQTVVS